MLTAAPFLIAAYEVRAAYAQFMGRRQVPLPISQRRKLRHRSGTDVNLEPRAFGIRVVHGAAGKRDSLRSTPGNRTKPRNLSTCLPARRPRLHSRGLPGGRQVAAGFGERGGAGGPGQRSPSHNVCQSPCLFNTLVLCQPTL